MAAKKLDGAVDATLTTAIKPDYAEAHNNLGIVLEELGEYKKALSF